jgi:hypothetical protein
MWESLEGNAQGEGTNPSKIGNLSASASSRAVCGATSGSGTHSSTSSSISYRTFVNYERTEDHGARARAHSFGQLDLVFFGGIRWRKEVVYDKDDEHQLEGGPHGIILVTGSNVADEDSRTWHLLERVRGFVAPQGKLILKLVEIHCWSYRNTRPQLSNCRDCNASQWDEPRGRELTVLTGGSGLCQIL